MINTITLDGLTMGTLDSGYLLGNLKGFELPEIKVDVKDRGNFHGARIGSKLFGRRVFTIELMILGDTKNDYESKRRALQQKLNAPSGTKVMRIATKSGLDLKSDVIVTDVDMEYQKGNMVFSEARIELTSEYPYIESYTSTGQTVYKWGGGGFAIPFGIPLDMSNESDALETITNDGNGCSFPTIRVYGQIQNPTLYNTTTDKNFVLNLNITDGNYVEIDTYNRTVTYNGVTNYKQYFSGDWLYLNPDENHIKLESTSQGDNARAFFIYNDSYLGI